MFYPIILDTDEKLLSITAFVTFRKVLKKMLRDCHHDVFGYEAEPMNTKQLMTSMRNQIAFAGEIVKTYSTVSMTAAEAGKMLAETTVMVYKILCMFDQQGFHIGRKMKFISGIVQDCPMLDAEGRLFYAVTVLDKISQSHDFFDAVGVQRNIQNLREYFMIDEEC